jgi:4'-phosphopantetheinyl transferase
LSPNADIELTQVTLQSTGVTSPPRTLLELTDPMRVEPGTIHVWTFSIEGEPELVQRCRACLSSGEQHRADRFVFARDRTRYTIAHAVLRHLLSRYCDVPPEALRFEASGAGKPILLRPALPAHAATLHFNLTHSEDRALVGVSEGRELGVDLEKVRANIEALSISQHYFFGSERDAIAASPTPGDTFFRYWVAKEAVLKAQGIGLGFPLDRFRVAFTPDHDTARIDTLDPAALSADWTVRMLPCESGWFAAVAARGTDWVVKSQGPVVTDPAQL